MNDMQITFGKVVATPTPSAWSQAYNAGNLFAVISLKSEEESLLNALGKEVIKTLEEEYFTLEEKSLASIKKAVTTASQKIPEEIKRSFIVATIIKDILYLYLQGEGLVLIKRGSSFGNLLSHRHSTSDEVLSASGFIENKDFVILQTKDFGDIITRSLLEEALGSSNPSEVAEALAPKIHEKENGAASAIILSFKKNEAEDDTLEAIEQEDESLPEIIPLNDKRPDQVTETEELPSKSDSRKSFSIPTFKLKLPLLSKLSTKKKVLLLIATVLIVILVISLLNAKNTQNNSNLQAKFQSVYQSANSKYNEGKSLSSLNQALANQDFLDAKKIVEGNLNSFPAGTPQRTQLEQLLNNINQELGPSQGQGGQQLKKASISEGLLVAEKNNPSSLYAAQNQQAIDIVSSDELYQVNSTGLDKKQIVKNTGNFKTPGGLATYTGNIYLLDKDANQIYKFVSSDSGTIKSNYLSSSESPNFANAQSMAIDSAVYVLHSNGTVDKYLRGSKQSFSLTGLKKPLNNPTKIFTSTDTNNIYILDSGNSRILVLGKDGTFLKDYTSSQIKGAKDFDVQESQKKIYILSSGTIYELDLQ